MSAASVVAVVYHLHVVDRIGYKIAKCLVICLRCKLEGALVEIEPVVESRNEVYGALTFYLLVQGGISYTIDSRGVAQLLEKRCLIIKACGKSQGDVIVETRYYSK